MKTAVYTNLFWPELIRLPAFFLTFFVFGFFYFRQVTSIAIKPHWKQRIVYFDYKHVHEGRLANESSYASKYFLSSKTEKPILTGKIASKQNLLIKFVFRIISIQGVELILSNK